MNLRIGGPQLWLPPDDGAGSATGTVGTIGVVNINIEVWQIGSVTLAVVEYCAEVPVARHAVGKRAAIELCLIGLQRQRCRFHPTDVHFQFAIAANAA